MTLPLPVIYKPFDFRNGLSSLYVDQTMPHTMYWEVFRRTVSEDMFGWIAQNKLAVGNVSPERLNMFYFISEKGELMEANVKMDIRFVKEGNDEQ